MVEDASMNERENILARVREALTVAAPVPGHEHRPTGGAPALPSVADQRCVLPRVGQSFDEQLTLFRANAAELRAEFRLIKDLAALVAELKGLCAAEGWQRAASHSGELAGAACRALGLPVLLTVKPLEKRELAQCDVGISECDALVAQTGSVVVTSRSAGGRALSVLPPHHVVLARREQLVPDLPAAFALLKSKYGAAYPSMISIITGPSRTGDIEMTIVVGVHGPGEVHMVILG
jgi:L-lactate dehydrogenase complex protein LldG